MYTTHPSNISALPLPTLALLLLGCVPPKDSWQWDTGSQETGEAADTALDASSDENDQDRDGYADSEDCSPTDADISPGVEEACDGIDNDCDDAIDEAGYLTWYTDADGDGYGDDATAILSDCVGPEDAVTMGGDCDDADSSLIPGVILVDGVALGTDDLQLALDSGGAEIQLCSGVYDGNYTASSDIRLYANGATLTSSTGNCFTTEGSTVWVYDANFTDCDNGVKLGESSKLTLKRSVMTNSRVTIYDYADFSLIESTQSTGTVGIHVGERGYALVKNSLISNNRWGVTVQNSGLLELVDASFTGNDTSVELESEGDFITVDFEDAGLITQTCDAEGCSP